MIIQRWQAPVFPNEEQLKNMLKAEGLDPQREEYGEKQHVSEHRHPFEEIRIVFSGELLINVAGNQLLLREGDRIEIPANTRHSTTANVNTVCIHAKRC